MVPNPLADLGAGLSTKSAPDHPSPVQHGAVGQTERAFTAASTFLSGLMAISATQFLGAPLKMIDPKFYDAYMAFTKQSFGVLITTMTQWWAPTVVRVSGDKSIPKQLFHKPDGSLECRFPKRLVMMANHQLYTDWLYLWWVAYTNNMHGYIYIILKESLKNIPIIGWGAQFYNFIFLKRKWEQDKDSFKQHLDQLSNTQDPMWLLIFPEGTNLAKGTREKSAEWARQRGLQDMKHQLLPRSKGLQFCLQNLKDSTEWLYDCTIGYEGIPPGEFGQDVFTLRSSMFEGRPPKSVNMHFRRFKIADIPVQNEKAFDTWLRNRWREKDYLLEHFAQYNRFPEDANWLVKQKQAGGTKGPVPAKSIETQIKSNSLEEFLSIFAPLSSVMTVLFLFYGGGKPEDMLKMVGDAAAQHNQKLALVRDDESQTEPLKLKKVAAAEDQETGKRPSPSVTAAQAQRNLVQQYVNAIRPAVAGNIDLPDRALHISNATNGQKKSQGAAKPGKAATTIAQKTKPAGGTVPAAKPKRAASVAAPLVTKTGTAKAALTPTPVKITAATPLKATPIRATSTPIKVVPNAPNRVTPTAAKPTPKPQSPRPQHLRTLSTASTVKPGDSISAVQAPTTNTRRSPITKGTTAAARAKPVAKKKEVEGEAVAKKVTVDPAMLMRMKAGSGKQKAAEGPKGVKIDPGVLARMKAGKS